jgi:hypothetical protein
VSLSLTGEDAKRVVQAVSSGRADRRVYSNMWLVTVRFFGGTNVLGEILTDGTLFLADGRQYKDASGVLDELVATPLSKMVHETEMKGTESP